MTAAKRSGTEPVTPAPPDIYNAFLKDLDLVGVRMVEGTFAARIARPPVTKSSVNVDFGAQYANIKGGFEATADFTFSFQTQGEDEPIGTVRSVFSLKYKTAQPMSDDIWAVFSLRNLRLNAWPYAREFAQSATQRMDWPKFTLPVANSTRLGAAKKPRAKSSKRAET
jgi:hypothetical protein